MATVNDGTVKWELYKIASNAYDDTITVSGSTAAVLNPAVNSIHYDGSITLTVLSQNKGIDAGTYTLKNIIQRLVDISHKHNNNQINGSNNCNCKCDCTCDCNCCFTETALVLMSDGSYKRISEVQIGDKVIGISGVNNVIGLHKVKLGNRRTLMTFAGEDLYFSGEHPFWIKTEDGNELWGSADINSYFAEHSNDYGEFVNRQLYPILVKANYATYDGWKENKPIVVDKFSPDIVLYDLILDGDYTYFANNYLVQCFVEKWDVDYSQKRWLPNVA